MSDTAGGRAAWPSGTVTFLFTDIEGSTALWERHELLMSRALARHDDVLREAIIRRGGHLFASAGDGVAASFSRAQDAVGAAVDIQRKLGAEEWPAPVEVRVRMGLHTGEADERGGDYFGPAVNRAARLMASANGGQIVISEVTAGLCSGWDNVQLCDLGLQRLKGILRPVRAFGVRAEGLAAADRPLVTADGPIGNLPEPVTSWFGPTGVVDGVCQALRDRRLVTLTGTGGVGKTRLAIEAGQRSCDQFPDGSWMLDASSIGDLVALVSALASMLMIPSQADRSTADSMAEWLRGRRVLLVLDNCEQIVESAATVVQLVLARCPTVTVLVTSREPLSVAGEWTVPVPPLTPADAARLFSDRSAAADSSADPSVVDAEAVREICERLEGIPLAIELAASRTRTLTPQEILLRLDDPFALLRAGRRSGPVRHETLRSTVEWSYHSLLEPEQRLFRTASVFAGGFDASAVEAIGAGADANGDVAVLDVLTSLVHKSMVSAEREGPVMRFRLLETMRAYGRDALAEHHDVEGVKDRHLDHFLALAERAARLAATVEQADADATFRREWENLRAAWAWAIETGGLDHAERLVAATGHFAVRATRHEHAEWTRRTLASIDAAGRRSPTCHGWASGWAFMSGDVDHAGELARPGTASLPDDPCAAMAWTMLSSAELAKGRRDDALAAAQHARTTAFAGDDVVAQAWALTSLIEVALDGGPIDVEATIAELVGMADRAGAPSLLARAAYHRGQLLMSSLDDQGLERALASFEHGVGLAQDVGDEFIEFLNLLGAVHAATSANAPSAWSISADVLARYHQARNWIGIWGLLDIVAGWWATTGRLEAAGVLYGYLEAHHHEPWGDGPQRSRRERGIEIVASGPDSEQWTTRGRSLDRDALVHYTIDLLRRSGPDPSDARHQTESATKGPR